MALGGKVMKPWKPGQTEIDRIEELEAEIKQLRAENEQLKVQLVKIMGTAHNNDRWKP